MKKLLPVLCLLYCLTPKFGFSQVTPQQDGDLYTISVANLVFTVDVSWGARVSLFTIDGDDFIKPLVSEEDVPCGCGSTVWPSPQSEMGFTQLEGNIWVPTPQLIDRGTYTASIEGDTMTFVSSEDMGGDEKPIVIIKKYWADAMDSTINMRLSLVNKGDEAISKSIWELTRVAPSGLFFFPKGTGTPWGGNVDLSVELEDNIDAYWYEYDAEHNTSSKWFANGSGGWSGFVDGSNHLFIKKYDDVLEANMAPNEAELEFWLATDFMELEVQSAYQEIAVDDTLHFDMKWYLRNMPAEITPEVGSQELLDYTAWVMTPKEIINGIEVPFAKRVKLYPNPALDILNIELPVSMGAISSVQLVDVSGKIAFNSDDLRNHMIDISQLNSGIYYVSVKAENSIYQGRFIKK